MAQHFQINLQTDDKHMKKLVDGVRYDIQRISGGLRGSLKYQELPSEYYEVGDEAVFAKNVSVPKSMVWGGRATLEVHMSGQKQINKIYLVA